MSKDRQNINTRSNISIPSSDLSVYDPNRQLKLRGERLRTAVKHAGGARSVAERAGVPFGTLNHYMSGNEMKLTAAAALAEACGVSLEWLVTGRGPSPAFSGDNDSSVSAPAESGLPKGRIITSQTLKMKPVPLFSQVNIDLLASAHEAVSATFKTPQEGQSTVRFLQAVIMLYDTINDPGVWVTVTQHGPDEADDPEGDNK